MDTQLWQLRFDSPLEFVSICASWTQSQCSVRCGFARERRRQSDRADLEWCNDAEAGRGIKKGRTSWCCDHVVDANEDTNGWWGFPVFRHTTTLPVVFILFFPCDLSFGCKPQQVMCWNCMELLSFVTGTLSNWRKRLQPSKMPARQS